MISRAEDKKILNTFREYFVDLDKRRVKLLYLLVQAMSTVSTVNLVKVAAALKTEVCSSSNYRRIQRFIHSIRVDFDALLPFLIKLLNISEPYTLLLDRTNWKFGVIDINYLVLSVKGDGWSVPIIWKLLPKKGNSNQEERIELMNRFISICGKGKIHSLIADREFIGSVWISYLKDSHIPYDIRIRENLKVLYRGKERRVSKIFSKLKVGQIKTINHPVIIGGVEVYMQGARIINTKNHKEEYLIVITSDDPAGSIERYGERWYIENMFKDLKSNGFNLESTHITKLDRLETLMFVLAIAYAWMIKIGKIVVKNNPKVVIVKKHGRKSKSVFRVGLDEFLRTVCTFNLIKFRLYAKVLSCT